ncbi:FHA domain-containing protein [bacterium]|nr:FHA domain-containing protein [candidate division CSSED10-310 bacterium]
MKVYCDNCMGENEIPESQVKSNGYRALCQNCGHMIYVDADAVDALLLRRNPIVDRQLDDLENDATEEMNSVAQSNITTTIAARLDLPRKTTSEAVLSILDGPDLGLEFVMDTSKIVIGRRGVDINLNDRLVSRRHVSIEASGGRYLLKDLGSTNGTFLNGSPVSMEFLRHGDEIQIGSTLIRFRIKSIEADIVVIDR